ncbi:hypothetical protein KAFR_0D01690 [Kazachstania africana CBS 2517]|uniref:CUE domain-containing protein n=1 Tax=Kazachstania africana (strain ATCC 22294 / BCRC 22015 / CBS 2517 / CECT 1963 / NBRC 1671 / NRRL Y-8276) TaxID=1071382 RepID=H2ATW6_KAZAF|nr:hypothetical protein KAFR_0D01690 [Kazachstania africana CBS 2517]CCF57816.1 hypothetical protein KAFR_0D01690 [Kazachstania africana CBS 2517]
MDTSTKIYLAVVIIAFFIVKKVNEQSKESSKVKIVAEEKSKSLSEGAVGSKIIKKKVTQSSIEVKDENGETIDGTYELSEEEETITPRKRPVTKGMIEIVQTMAPNLSVAQIKHSLEQTGSIEKTMESVLRGDDFTLPGQDQKLE